MPTLSKSRFVSGSQCEKKLFFDVFQKDLRPPVSEQQQALFDSGHVLGFLAQAVFPGGKDASPDETRDYSRSIEFTSKWIREGVQTIYEATFSVPGGFAALDILHRESESLWAIEVKGSGELKDYHLLDAAFQYWVMKTAGHTPDRFFMMLVNKAYVKKGEIVPGELFRLEDITEKVIAMQPELELKKTALIAMLEAGTESVKEIGPHCSAPFSCDYMSHCWSHIPENSVFQLHNSRGKEWELYENGIAHLGDIPIDFPLSPRQKLQVEGVKSNATYIDKPQVSKFLQTFQAPLHFFDFETINPAIPILEGTSPFNQVPFQYSLHVTDMGGNITAHREFLADPADFNNSGTGRHSDVRYQMITQMKRDFCDTGSILAYYASFEISRLKELANEFPEERAYLESLSDRFIDLIIPFRKAWYYLPKMGSSASIKFVLPAIDPVFSYEDLEISNGGMASNTFLSMITQAFEGDESQTRKNLLKYCERDTEGMVIIYRKLLEVVCLKN